MASLSSRIQAVVVPGVGHNVRLESPEEYLATLESFLWQPSSSWVG